MNAVKREIRGTNGVLMATRNDIGRWICALCPAWLQRTLDGRIEDGVAAHYTTVHSAASPERKLR